MAEEHQEFDPWNDTTTERGQVVDEPFADRPHSSLVGPAGQIQALAMLSGALGGSGWVRRLLAFLMLCFGALVLLRVYSGLI